MTKEYIMTIGEELKKDFPDVFMEYYSIETTFIAKGEYKILVTLAFLKPDYLDKNKNVKKDIFYNKFKSYLDSYIMDKYGHENIVIYNGLYFFKS